MARVSTLAASLLLAAASAYGQTLKAVDAYRSEQVTAEALAARLGSLPADYARLRGQGRARAAARLKARIKDEVSALGDFAFVGLYGGDYANSAGRAIYLTFDLVDAKDARTRMSFRAAPAGRFADPGGLLALWKRYDAVGLKQSTQGYIDDDQRPRCPGFYCRWGSGTPALASLEGQIAASAQPNKTALMGIARDDASAGNRATALYVLSYTDEGAEVAKLMLAALDDPAPEPRAAALQVLSQVADHHKEIGLDIARLAAALDYPTTSDRAKALDVLLAKADDPVARPALIGQVVPRLLPLLKLSQPSNHDPAFTILTMLSGESYSGRDYDAWEKWISAQSATASMSSPKNAH